MRWVELSARGEFEKKKYVKELIGSERFGLCQLLKFEL